MHQLDLKLHSCAHTLHYNQIKENLIMTLDIFFLINE